MKYNVVMTIDNIKEYHVLEGTAYIGFSVMGGSGFQVDEVKENDSWREGSGEEVCIVAESDEEAWDYITRTYLEREK